MSDDSHTPDCLGSDEAFHNSFYYFIDALESLAADAEATCERMGDYNTAWELRDDILSHGRALMDSWPHRFSENERSGIKDLLATVEAVPTHVLPGGAGRSLNLSAMQHVSWASPRLKAAQLLDLLSEAVQSTREYFRLD